MAVGSGALPTLHAIAGFRLGCASAGIKKPGRRDLVVMELCEGAQTAATFTLNAFCAAPVQVAKSHLSDSSPRYLLINTGNANAGTGERGLGDCHQCCIALARQAGTQAQSVLPFSTGVIGEPLPVEKIVAALPAALADLRNDGWSDAATGIMTTDTRPKAASRQFECDGHPITITGIAKGAGMIKPNMATMLAYVATDMAIARNVLDELVTQAVNRSFNRITIDGDTSTNDACVLVATGQASGQPLTSNTDARFPLVLDQVTGLFIELAQGLVRDGEGATKFVSVEVSGGKTDEECLRVAYTIAESPLVKTALFASDPNWGRLLAAIGRAGVDQLDVSKVDVSLNGILIAESGGRAVSYTEEQGAQAMAAEEITISVSLHRGESATTVWTTDLSYDYVKINAEYRT